ncbi:heme A synthase [Wolbachia endosymbiont of Dipetalonema caudispina]|uniref:COX15/CtaA family protein n=1 Tax=Wolbachia endosymbiont of Dipetalonema caudispina TaxID=1812112 RepID=UPI001588F495|nr:COX15/CtaA family protein [Wolbachia endosymbiont of Dipetalonema caudispina]QKX01219.1 heme A synthase [Wolbachia endosymbiont of Dipetalonema caudispina]
MKQKISKPVIIWLFLCSTMIIIMVGIGGFTRLSKAGLSITEWKPFTGTLPPLNEQDWLQEKLRYEATPEYKIFNYSISTEEFRILYLIEYIHRLAARLIGLAFILPFIYFLLNRKISKKVAIRLSIVLLLGTLQALTGWYMVKSGLVSEPYVSHYRLALHLLLTLAIFALLLYQFFDYQIQTPVLYTPLHKYYNIKTIFTNKNNISVPKYQNQKNLTLNKYVKQTHNKNQTSMPNTKIIPLAIHYTNYNIYYITLTLTLVTIQIIFGAFVAGLNAGLTYNTFPLMNERIIPEDLFSLQPIWINIFENKTTVQFIHRALALIILVLTIILTMKNTNIKSAYIMLLSVIVQIILGIATLLLHIPIAVAIAHQIFSFILFGSGIYFLCYLRKQTTSPTRTFLPS